jgi:hypothetical protein
MKGLPTITQILPIAVQAFELDAKKSRYKDGTTKACSIVFLNAPYRALQSDRCLVITT